ncbi:Ohr family peroxiredoxin, partial [Streptomyces sp. SID10244]|nr:Ohr family peroxiredoxin [Streptomyces sp. SID10244]
MKAIYTAEALATGDGRNGHARTSDGKLDVDLDMPKELGGSGVGTNPEQLFAAGYAACFHSALRLVAGQAGADVTD